MTCSLKGEAQVLCADQLEDRVEAIVRQVEEVVQGQELRAEARRGYDCCGQGERRGMTENALQDKPRAVKRLEPSFLWLERITRHNPDLII